MTNYHFWTAQEKGYFYPCHQTEPTEDWPLIQGQLEILASEGKVEEGPEGFLLPHARAVELDPEISEILELPDYFPYAITLRSHGSLGSPSFRYEVEYLRPDGTPFYGLVVRGSYVELSRETCYRFNRDQYDLLSLVEESNRESQKIQDRGEVSQYNTLQLARIKERAEKIHATLDRFMERQKVVTADKLSVRLEKNPDGSFSVLPVLLRRDGDSYTRIEADSLDQGFRSNPYNTRKIYGPDKTQYVFTPEQAEGIRQMRQCQRLSPEAARQVAEHPREVFGSEAFDFDLGVYGDRVVSIGEFLAPDLPFSLSSGRNWLPPEGTVEEDGREGSAHKTETLHLEEKDYPELFLLEEKGYPELFLKVSDALDRGEKRIVLGSQEVELTPEFLDYVDQLKAKAAEKQREQVQGSESTGEKKKDASLQIQENFLSREYHSRKAKREKQLNGNRLGSFLGKGLKAGIRPMPHQQVGLEQLAACWESGCHGVLLADDMGLGKTLQAFGFLAALKKAYGSGDMASVLIVAPVSLLQNWMEEYRKFVAEGVFDGIVPMYGSELKKHWARNPDGSRCYFRPPDPNLKEVSMLDFQDRERQIDYRQNHLILTTYETLRELQLSFGRVAWSVMILDEAQKIKNPATRTSVAARAMNCDFGLALTGTPVENSWTDLWTIMDFVEPGKLESLKDFNSHYQSQLKNVENDGTLLKKLGDQLRKNLDPCFIRRLKEDVNLGLPAKEILRFKDPMPEEQRKMYGEVVRAARQENQPEENSMTMLQAIARLRDISLYPFLGREKAKNYPLSNPDLFFGSSARLMRTRKILDEVRAKGEKALIFVESRKLQLLLRTFLEKAYGVQVQPPINGTTQAVARQKMVDQFNGAPGFQVLLLSPEAAGVGLNITGANHVIHLSRCWNPAKEDQATDRAYRIGQKKAVTVYLPMAVDTDFPEEASFDLNLDDLLQYKRDLSRSALYPTEASEENAMAILKRIEKAAG
ncbi:DEAD/DEAH box helicase [Acidaminococcus timonensis]|uniref:DEAD/DEAH box helicase n=1 Tax=Acidaminococcus timonensis TaxID=1871002 RepID=UPI0008DA3816|nr:DEAD/DEAH box helicase [Acidaminococcus timonensis]